MSRHTAALNSLGSSNTLAQTVEALLFAVRETECEGKDPHSDAAVMLLGSQVAFMTHADVATATMFDALVDSCESRQVETIVLNAEQH